MGDTKSWNAEEHKYHACLSPTLNQWIININILYAWLTFVNIRLSLDGGHFSSSSFPRVKGFVKNKAEVPLRIFGASIIQISTTKIIYSCCQSPSSTSIHFHRQWDSIRPLVPYLNEISQTLECRRSEALDSRIGLLSILGYWRACSKSGNSEWTQLSFLLLDSDDPNFDHLKTWPSIPNSTIASVPEPLVFDWKNAVLNELIT